jgi:hypothetical protein
MVREAAGRGKSCFTERTSNILATVSARVEVLTIVSNISRHE